MYHRGWFFQYFGWIVVAVVPWCGVLVVAVALAARRWRRDARLRMVMLWALAVLVPLCLAGQKQRHYLMPMLPALAILCGWLMDRALRGRPDRMLGKLGEVLVVGTAGVCVIAAMAAPIFGKLSRATLAAEDWTLVLGVLALGVIGWLVLARRGTVALAMMFTASTTMVMAFVTCAWTPSLKRVSARETAAELRQQFGANRPCVFYGVVEIPAAWYLRAIVPGVETEADLRDVLARDPRTVVIATDPADKPPKPLPPDLTVWRTYAGAEKTTRVCLPLAN
jgi:4-amino-4-deoxy-L-arabinose transferase-like glycosyltransferase